jgi:hypothetical protein
MAVGKLKRGQKAVIPQPKRKKDEVHIGITQKDAEKAKK